MREYASKQQLLMQDKQPVQSFGFEIFACLCQGKSILPITLFGQVFKHLQHALHF